MGIAISSEMYKRIKRVEALISLTNDFENMIRYRALTIKEMIEETSKSYEILSFIKNIETDGNIHNSWKNAVLGSVMGNEEKEIMILFGNSLGTTDINGQISTIKVYRKRLENLYKKISEEYSSKGRMYRSAGVLIGIMAGIMLI